uniref:VQ domain-containing protein n=1 Tax=Leersia perrieri TaxID=77586 RepID=A0A0D9UZN6_9ORYZ
MANRCVSLDATWAHLPAPPPPPPATWLSTAFADDALTAALWASMSPSSAATGAASYRSAASPSPTPSSSTTTTTSSASAGGVDILAATPARAATRPTGRVAKRKPRPSRHRAHTTYISADPADFRRMVQEITGFPAVPGAAVYASSTPAPHHTTSASATTALACVLPTLDTSAFLLDRASPPPEPKRKTTTTAVSPATAMASTSPAPEHEASSSMLMLQELEEMMSSSAAYPTLESWGMI